MPYTRLRYHITTGTYERQPIITFEIEQIIYAAMRTKADKIGGKIMYINGVEDHVHMIAAIPPSLTVSKFIGAIKASSSGAVNRRNPVTPFQWQEGYGAFTVHPDDMDDLISYVLNQKEHHARGDLNAAWERSEE